LPVVGSVLVLAAAVVARSGARIAVHVVLHDAGPAELAVGRQRERGRGLSVDERGQRSEKRTEQNFRQNHRQLPQVSGVTPSCRDASGRSVCAWVPNCALVRTSCALSKPIPATVPFSPY